MCITVRACHDTLHIYIHLSIPTSTLLLPQHVTVSVCMCVLSWTRAHVLTCSRADDSQWCIGYYMSMSNQQTQISLSLRFMLVPTQLHHDRV
jgi:hypothetical protein